MFNYYKLLRILFLSRHKSFIFTFILRLLYLPYKFILKVVYGAYIPYSADISFSCKFPHSFYGIFISRNAKIEKNCIILHHVTIGSGIPNTNRAPHIKENTFIGVNSCIIGDITIGSNVKIGAGTTVTKNIKSNVTVVNSSFRILNEN